MIESCSTRLAQETGQTSAGDKTLTTRGTFSDQDVGGRFSRTAVCTSALFRRPVLWLALLLATLAFTSAHTLQEIRTVFLIVMENRNWSEVAGNTNCPFINQVLLPQSSYCERYFNPPNLHPSEPNYLWLVAGTNFGILNNNLVSTNSQTTTNHLAFLLDKAGVSWKTYQAGISGLGCPTNQGVPTSVVDPFLFFETVTRDPEYCRSHIRPYEELSQDLITGNVARFNLIAPGLCNAMHAPCGPADGDKWLSSEIPKIMASTSYKDSGAIFITWDEGSDLAPNAPIGMIVVSPLAKGGGFRDNLIYSHSSTLRTVQRVFGVYPLLGDAANAADLSELFTSLRLYSPNLTSNGQFTFVVGNVTPTKPNVIQSSTDLLSWGTIRIEAAQTNYIPVREAVDQQRRFYRVVEEP